MTSDKVFWSALVFGIFFWGGLFFYVEPQLSLLWPLHHPVAFVIPSLIYPILEEVVFRGFVQENLSKFLQSRRFGPITAANIVTSLLFTVMHFFFHMPLWAAAVFLPSLVFGYFKDKYMSLGPPILLHVYYNSGYYWIFGAVSD